MQALAHDLGEAQHVLDVRALPDRPVLSALPAPARAALPRVRIKSWFPPPGSASGSDLPTRWGG